MLVGKTLRLRHSRNCGDVGVFGSFAGGFGSLGRWGGVVLLLSSGVVSGLEQNQIKRRVILLGCFGLLLWLLGLVVLVCRRLVVL